MLNCHEKALTASSDGGGPSTEGTSQNLSNIKAVRPHDGLVHSVLKNKSCNDQFYRKFLYSLIKCYRRSEKLYISHNMSFMGHISL